MIIDRNIRKVLLALAVTLTSAGCGGDVNGSEPTPADAPAALQVGAEDVVKVDAGEIVVGPMISGELRAAREATVRAELGGSMVQVTFEEGQPVRSGAVLGRIGARALDNARQSAASAVASAENQLAVARREVERTEQLVAAGALAQRDQDLARNGVTSAEAQLADARSRLASAEAELGDAILRAPIGGVLSERAVNVGDVVSPGTELFTIIDPSSMRLEASVPSDDLKALRVGAPVQFTVRGYDQSFEGKIERIAPQADAVTRQVPIYVALPNDGGRLVAGLFAEGRVVSESAGGLVVPSNAVNMTGGAPWVLRVAGGRAERVEVMLGLRDARTERVQVTAGLSEGDVLLRGAAQGISPGTPVTVGSAR